MRDGFALYLNLWGTTAKLVEADDGGTYFRPDQVEACQERFAGCLARLPSSLHASQAADIAVVTGASFHTLLEFAIGAFHEMLGSGESFRLWPLRAAIARGTTLLDGTAIGAGVVEAARLEKSAQKGARFFLEHSLHPLLPNGARVRETDVRGRTQLEMNWLAPGCFDRVAPIELATAIPHLFAVESNYCRQLAASLAELERWR